MPSISAKLGCTAETLRRWVRQAERDEGKRGGLTTAEADGLEQLRRENKELKRANDILRTRQPITSGEMVRQSLPDSHKESPEYPGWFKSPT